MSLKVYEPYGIGDSILEEEWEEEHRYSSSHAAMVDTFSSMDTAVTSRVAVGWVAQGALTVGSKQALGVFGGTSWTLPHVVPDPR